MCTFVRQHDRWTFCDFVPLRDHLSIWTASVLELGNRHRHGDSRVGNHDAGAVRGFVAGLCIRPFDGGVYRVDAA